MAKCVTVTNVVKIGGTVVNIRQCNVGHLHPVYHMVPWKVIRPTQYPERHLDRFNRFAGLTIVTDRQTDRQTTTLLRL